MPCGLMMSQDVHSRCARTSYRLFPWHYCHSWWYMHIWPYPWRVWLTLASADEDGQPIQHHLQQPQCQIRQPQITFYSAVFTAKGMWPDPSKIQALQDLPTPNSSVKLQSFLGLINYLQPFIPGLSKKTTFLCEQFAEWDWNPLMGAAFQHLKVWICQTLLNTTLMYYDCSKPVIVQTDASEYGLGTALLSPMPVRPLMMWRICMQILSALALRSFTHTSMAGTLLYKMTINPWRWSCKSPFMLDTPCLQHMLLCMQKYDYTHPIQAQQRNGISQ